MTETAVDRRPASNVVRAALWMAGALLAFSGMAIAGRKAQVTLDTYQVMFGRAAIGLLILLALHIATGATAAEMATRRPSLHVLRNLIHYGAQFSWFYALNLIPLATLFAVEFTCPLWVALLAPLLLGEKLTANRVAAAVLGFAGILVIVQPGVNALSSGLAFGLVSAIGYALAMLCTKSLMRTESPFQVLLLMHAMQLVIGAIAMTGRWVVPSQVALIWVAAVAVCGLCAHYCQTRAFALADAIIVAPMDFMRLPLIAAVGVLAYGEGLDPWVLAGAAVIVAANLLNVFGERRSG